MKQEYQRKIDDCTVELAGIKSWIDSHQMDTNVRYLVSYAVVKTSGTIELVFKQMLYDFLAVNAISETQHYLSTMIIDSSCNPNTGNISRFVSQADGHRSTAFDVAVSGVPQHKSNLNSLVSLRNDLAHGRTNSPSINTVKTYFESGVEIIKILDRILTPPNGTT